MNDTERLNWLFKNCLIQTEYLFSEIITDRKDIDRLISEEYWDKVHKAAKAVEEWPDWMKG